MFNAKQAREKVTEVLDHVMQANRRKANENLLTIEGLIIHAASSGKSCITYYVHERDCLIVNMIVDMLQNEGYVCTYDDDDDDYGKIGIIWGEIGINW